ncbi:uncharacterized protein LOC115228602 [Octopus sinensis]|uniref:Uncharacterized protein LOC115228602 n=1 Tax=Octopus sinensis TaxID=2607531 RepID=A0A6P7TS03_9MOLL|nr:uncharacterized protein LOC115228602 [Octopus sinensis]
MANKMSLAAYNAILDSNLVAKFAYEDFLGINNLFKNFDCTNITGDTFLDIGKMKTKSNIQSLEAYCKQPINQNLPYVLFNFYAQTTEKSISENDDEEDTSNLYYKSDDNESRNSLVIGIEEPTKEKLTKQKTRWTEFY